MAVLSWMPPPPPRAARRRFVAVTGAIVAAVPAMLAPTAHADQPRAYEMVSPIDKADGDVLGLDPITGPRQSSASGDGVLYGSLVAFSDPQSSPNVNVYLSERTADGWTTDAIMPPQAPRFNGNFGFSAFSSDLGQGILTSADPPLSAGASPGTGNLYLRDREGAYELLSPNTPSNNAFYEPAFAAATPDFGHVLFQSTVGLTPDAPPAASNHLYEWTSEGIRLVGILPDDTPAPGGAVTGSVPANRIQNAGVPSARAISEDGSRIFFQALTDGEGRELYVREDASSTTWVSESQRDPVDPNGTKPARFWTASRDGRFVFFTSQEALTDDANTGPDSTGTDLYRYDVDTGELVDVAPHADGAGAEVRGVVDASDDGSWVYFVAGAELVDGEGTAGEPNLYSWHEDGGITFLGTLDGADSIWWETTTFSTPPPHDPVTPDGTQLLITSSASLVGDTGGFVQVFRIDGATGATVCVSCDPGGAAPTGDATTRRINLGFPTHTPGRAMTDDARTVWFETPDALVPDDRNGAVDVYEYDEGVHRLISSGRPGTSARFHDASADGRDVFFVTRERLVKIDKDDYADLYDARRGGGIAAQNPPDPPPAGCYGDACQGPPAGGGSGGGGTPPAPSTAATPPSGSPREPLPPPGLPAEDRPERASIDVRDSKARANRVVLRVWTPEDGRVAVRGRRVAVTHAYVRAGETQRIVVRLTAKARKRLKRKERLDVRLRIGYANDDVPAEPATVRVTFVHRPSSTSTRSR